MADAPSVTIPDKPAFKASEVCELAQIQPYVLRSWESEFPELGLSKTPGGPRIYRRTDVERVLRIRDLVFTEGLTLSGVRRRFESEQPPAQDDLLTFMAEVQAHAAQSASASAASSAPGHVVPVSDSGAPRAAGGVVGSSSTTEEGLPQEARAKIVQLKQEMRSLLDMLGGVTPTVPAPPVPAPAPKRSRRTPHA